MDMKVRSVGRPTKEAPYQFHPDLAWTGAAFSLPFYAAELKIYYHWALVTVLGAKAEAIHVAIFVIGIGGYL
jgi:hypothetical protein